jgi:hypothetical protein
MKQTNHHAPSVYCPWKDGRAPGCGIATGTGKQITFDEAALDSLDGQVSWNVPGREWQANSMDQPVDEHTASDLVAIAETRHLSASQCNMLARNVTGALRPNRDIFLWVLANVLSAVFLSSSRRRKAFKPMDCALEIVLSRPADLRSALARHCDGAENVRVSVEGIAIDIDGLRFEAGWARIEDALAFGEFFITGNDGALYGSFNEAVLALSPAGGAASGPKEAVGILSRRIAQWRRDHLPLGRHERLFSALIGFLANRPAAQRRHGMLAFNDDDIVAFWRKSVEDGERSMFRTAVERFRDFGRLMTHLNAIRNLGAPGDLDALVARMDMEPEEGWNETADDLGEVRLLNALNSLPTDPKVLTGVERESIASLVALMPFHKQRPLSVLRVFGFGPVQTGIANRLRRGGGGAEIKERVTCVDAKSYDDVAHRFQALLAHLESLRRIAVALRFGDSSPTVEVADPVVLAAMVQQGNADLRRLRREGFDRPRNELAAVFAGIDGVLNDLCAVVQDFTAELDRIDRQQARSARFAQDMPVFIETFTCAYIAEQEHESDV